MSTDYTIGKCTRRCAVSGRALEPGEAFVSVLLPSGEELIRQDVAAREWQGPSDATIGWWRARMPEAGPKKMRPAPNGVLLDTLSGLVEMPGKEPLAYLLALLLVRRRVLTEEELLVLDETEENTDVWKLVSVADGRQWEVPVATIAPPEMEALQTELNTLLFTEE